MEENRPVASFTVSPGSAGQGDALSMHPADLARLGWHAGDTVAVTAVARTAARLAALDASAPQGRVTLGPFVWAGTGAAAGQAVQVEAVPAARARRVVLASIAPGKAAAGEQDRPASWHRLLGLDAEDEAKSPHPAPGQLLGVPVTAGSVVQCGPDGEPMLRVISTEPEGTVRIDETTEIDVVDPFRHATSYADVGGLSEEVARIREMVELPLRQPGIFTRLGIDPPRGLLLYGPPGCGKTLIARAIARQTDAFFLSVSGPEIIQKHYGESEELLRKVFEEAQKHPAAILFIDEIDALAPNRETVLGEVEKRVVAQLLALMDGVASRGRIVVMAATNLPNSIDPALRRPGRFDREIAINPPGKAGRLEILKIHARYLPLAADVALERIAAVTHGFLGADLAALCREAAMACARDNRAAIEAAGHGGGPLLFVRMEHFRRALKDFRLSTLRELSSEVPETRWEDIGGLDEPKRLLRQALEWPLLYAPRFAYAAARAPRGILLTGRSGTGKTLLAQAVGSTAEINFIVARGPELLSKWVGESERGIRDVFRRARQSAPSIVFFDEIDAIAPSRGKGNGDAQLGDRMVGQFLLELDNLDDASGVTVLAATNRPDLLDRALLRPGRFDLVIDLPAPDRAARLAILKVHSRSSPVAPDVDLGKLADATEGMSGAELAAVCEQAKMRAIAQSVERQPDQAFAPFTIDVSHWQAALGTVAATHATVAATRLAQAANDLALSGESRSG